MKHGNWLSRTMGTMSWSRFHGLSHGILHLSQSSSHAQASEGKKQGTIIIHFCWEHFGVSLGALLPLYHHIIGIGKFTGRIYYFILTGKLVLSPYRQRKRLSSDKISSELWSEDFKYQNAYMFASKYPCSVSIVQQASEMLKIRNFLRISSILQVGNTTPNFMWLATVKKMRNEFTFISASVL